MESKNLLMKMEENKFTITRIIGEHTITLPTPPKLSTIDNYGLPLEKQRFARTETPKDFKLWEADKKKEFIRREWKKRNEGYWFFNGGRLEYITGVHYFYINYWRINTGFPMFVDSDRDFFYVWDHCVKTPTCDGLMYVTHRGEGKTYKASSIVYEIISKQKNVKGGIQSKNEGDAKKVFQKLVFSWSKLPYFFKPIDVGLNRPVRSLEFFAPSTRNTKSQEREDSDVLNSLIDFESAKEEAYDGDNQKINFQDEIGKCIEADVDARMKVVRECLRGGRGERGKIIATTTVEEMEKHGGKKCKLIWDKSSITKLDDNGFTQSGLYKHFKPSYYGYLEIMNGESFVDEFGYSLIDKAKKYFENKRKALKGADLSSEKRKFPFEEKECWITDSKKAMYDVVKIEQQLEHNQNLPDFERLLVRGNFTRKGGEKDGIVEWNPNPQGKWLVAWMPKPDDRNKSVMKFGKKAPANTERGCFGLDPYDNKVTVDDRKSDAAAYGFLKFDPMITEDSGIFICEYVNRPELPEIMWEDMIMQCEFYGWEILIENNRIGTINHFRMRGKENYLMKRPEETLTAGMVIKKDDFGIAMSGEDARMALVYATESYIIKKVGLIEEEGQAPRMGKCYFNKLLTSWLEFDFDQKWTKFDSMVGAGLALLGSRKYIPKKREDKSGFLQDAFFPKYNSDGKRVVQGNDSVIIGR